MYFAHNVISNLHCPIIETKILLAVVQPQIHWISLQQPQHLQEDLKFNTILYNSAIFKYQYKQNKFQYKQVVSLILISAETTYLLIKSHLK